MSKQTINEIKIKDFTLTKLTQPHLPSAWEWEIHLTENDFRTAVTKDEVIEMLADYIAELRRENLAYDMAFENAMMGKHSD